MRLAYHYHTELYKENEQYWISGNQGVFIEELAEAVEELHLIFHVTKVRNSNSDFRLKSTNIVVHDLGLKTSAWKRFFTGPENVLNFENLRDSCIDFFIFRSPSPLIVYFSKLTTTKNTFFYVVGDYQDGAKHYSNKGFRKFSVKLFTSYMGLKINKAYANRRLIVNSPALLDKLKSSALNIELIKTTTLSSSLIKNRNDTFNKGLIKVLYAGRFDWNKGLKELLEGFKRFLEECKVKAELSMVGWEDDPNRSIENEIRQIAAKLGIERKLKFLGRKKVGKELNACYRDSDVYVLPSYNEGFPRTLWEAMGQGTPVITTKVGGIPNILSHKFNAFLIEPHSSEEVFKALNEMYWNHDLRKRIIKNGFALAETNTLEIQVQNIIKHLNNSQ